MRFLWTVDVRPCDLGGTRARWWVLECLSASAWREVGEPQGVVVFSIIISDLVEGTEGVLSAFAGKNKVAGVTRNRIQMFLMDRCKLGGGNSSGKNEHLDLGWKNQKHT